MRHLTDGDRTYVSGVGWGLGKRGWMGWEGFFSKKIAYLQHVIR